MSSSWVRQLACPADGALFRAALVATCTRGATSVLFRADTCLELPLFYSEEKRMRENENETECGGRTCQARHRPASQRCDQDHAQATHCTVKAPSPPTGAGWRRCQGDSLALVGGDSNPHHDNCHLNAARVSSIDRGHPAVSRTPDCCWRKGKKHHDELEAHTSDRNENARGVRSLAEGGRTLRVSHRIHKRGL